jgi:hypothetical protein
MDANLISAIGSLTGPALRRRTQTFVKQCLSSLDGLSYRFKSPLFDSALRTEVLQVSRLACCI